MHSRESMDFIPRYAPRIPVLGALVAQQERSYRAQKGCPVDYTRAWWTPPLNPSAAWRTESRQIEDTLGLLPLVSLTDHDSIEAPELLCVTGVKIPLSLEWTIPYERTFFHLGVHNLPIVAAHEFVRAMHAYTAAPVDRGLHELLETLNSHPETLLVLNHPLWDEAAIGMDEHKTILRTFLTRHGSRIHALELNGLRSWRENCAVLRWAQSAGLPVISGGDRHGCEPNALINLTNATTFAEFVQQVRIDKFSHVLLLPQCREPLGLRRFEVLRDALEDMPDAAGRERWSDRVFYRTDSGAVLSFAALWGSNAPALVRYFVSLVKLFTNPGVRHLVRAALWNKQEVPS